MSNDSPEMIIDLKAVAQNFTIARSLAGAGAEVAAVVKSDAYGLGLDAIVDLLAGEGCESFFVADLDEACRIRKCLRQAKVFILVSVPPDQVEHCRRNGFVPICNRLSDVLAALQENCCYGVNLETGFSRFGLTFSDTRQLIHQSLSRPLLAMSHLSCADEPSNPLNELQRNRFVSSSQLLGSSKLSLAASAGLFLGKAYHFDLVRVGSALYGLNPTLRAPNPFRNVVTLRARLVDVTHIHAGSSVGYRASFRARRRTRLGIVAIGYAHGLAWSLSNRLIAEIGSHPAPLVGRIAMEYAAVDLTDLPEQLGQVGQWINLISAHRPTEEMADAVPTVPQEMLVRIGRSCQHSYVGLEHQEQA